MNIRLNRVFISFLATFALLFALMSTLAPSEASAGTPCTVTRICGLVVNGASSPRTIGVACNYGGGVSQWLRPGQKSTCADADQVYIPAGYIAIISQYGTWQPGWHKINDFQRPYVQLYRR